MNTQEIIDIEDKYFINTFNRVPVVLDHGEGVKVWDIEGKEYLDFLAGIAVNCLFTFQASITMNLQQNMLKDWLMLPNSTECSLQTLVLKPMKGHLSLL